MRLFGRASQHGKAVLTGAANSLSRYQVMFENSASRDVICVKIPMCFLIGIIWSGRVRPLPGGAPLNLKTECSVVLHGLPTRPIVDIMKLFCITWQLFVRRFGLSRPHVGGNDRLLCEGDLGVVILGSCINKGFNGRDFRANNYPRRPHRFQTSTRFLPSFPISFPHPCGHFSLRSKPMIHTALPISTPRKLMHICNNSTSAPVLHPHLWIWNTRGPPTGIFPTSHQFSNLSTS